MKIKCVASGTSFTACVDENGRVWTFGENGRGQLGHSERESRCVTPKVVKGVLESMIQILVFKLFSLFSCIDKNVLHLTCGDRHVVAYTEDGELYSWGRNGSFHWIVGFQAIAADIFR